MKRILLLIAALLCWQNAFAAPAIVQARVNCNAASGVAATCTYGTNPTLGSVLIFVGATGTSDPNTTFGSPSVTGCTGAGSVTHLGGSPHASTQWVNFYWAPVNSSTACIVTWGGVADGSTKGMTVYEVSGLNTTTQPDGACTFAQVSGFSSPGPVTVAMTATSIAADFLIGEIGSGDATSNFTFGSDTVQSGWTNDTGGATNMNWHTEYQITASASTYTAGWSTVTQHGGGARDLNVGACALKGNGGGGGSLNFSAIRIGGGN